MNDDKKLAPDHFGISAGIEGAARVYFYGGRKSGRTISLVESVKDGDRLIFTTSKEANRVKRLCDERGVKIEVMSFPATNPERVFHRPPAEGRTIFDHSWVEEFYMNAIRNAQDDINKLQGQSSGFGAAHRETKRAAEERMKWEHIAG